MAETLALQALAYIVGESTLCGRFLDLTGVNPSDLHASVQDRAFLAAVIEFLLAHEPNLLAFCADAGIEPTLPARAHHVLRGNSAPDWN